MGLLNGLEPGKFGRLVGGAVLVKGLSGSAILFGTLALGPVLDLRDILSLNEPKRDNRLGFDMIELVLERLRGARGLREQPL